MKRTLVNIIIILAASITSLFLVLIASMQTTSENEVKDLKTNIKRRLYTLNIDYRDEYVDLWYDIMNNPLYDEVVVNRNTIYSWEDTNSLYECKTNIEKMLNTCNKLIDIYGADSKNVFYISPWYKIIRNKEEFETYLNENEFESIESIKKNFPDYDKVMKGEKFLPIFINTNTLNNFKLKCKENIKIIQNILDYREKEKQEKEELEKIVYGND